MTKMQKLTVGMCGLFAELVYLGVVAVTCSALATQVHPEQRMTIFVVWAVTRGLAVAPLVYRAVLDHLQKKASVELTGAG